MYYLFVYLFIILFIKCGHSKYHFCIINRSCCSFVCMDNIVLFYTRILLTFRFNLSSRRLKLTLSLTRSESFQISFVIFASTLKRTTTKLIEEERLLTYVKLHANALPRGRYFNAAHYNLTGFNI